MNIFAGLETFLYVISSALFYPVVAGLVLLTFWMVISFGGFLREYVDRRQGMSMPLRRYQKMLEDECQNRGNTELDINLERLLQASELELV
ncbi:MAG: MotA/TolQ/ExbB proton channel family protein, partial [Candidatus Desantisbacteria bacterium]